MKFNSERIYQHIGYLLYGLFNKYKKASMDDLNMLRDYIEKIWRPSDAQHVSIDLTDAIHAGVQYALENSLTADQAMNSFKDYFMIHSNAFGSALREKILSSVKTLSEEFFGENAPKVTSKIQMLLVS